MQDARDPQNWEKRKVDQSAPLMKPLQACKERSDQANRNQSDDPIDGEAGIEAFERGELERVP